MQIFDTHCHYNLEPLYSGKAGFFSKDQVQAIKQKNWQIHWQQAQKQGAAGALIPGASLKNSKKAIKIASKEKNLFASTAIHPGEIAKFNPADINKQFSEIKQLSQNPNVIAIGETGLDYLHLPKNNKQHAIKQQKDYFIKHILLANKLKKPLIIHARDGSSNQLNTNIYHEILQILKQHYQFQQPFVLHCVSGPESYVKQALDLGAYISFAGNITYPSADDLRQLLQIVPENKLLLETDAPFLPPQKYRGQINQPYMIVETAKYVAAEFEIDLDLVLQNSYRFYNLEIEDF